MAITISCPVCSEQFDLREARNEQAWRQLIELIMEIPPFLHRPLWDYLGLFKPAKQNNIRSTKMLAIVSELAPMIKAGKIKEQAVPQKLFGQVMWSLANHTPETLRLPLKSNGYLLQVIKAKAEALSEEQIVVAQRQEDGGQADSAHQKMLDASEKEARRKAKERTQKLLKENQDGKNKD